MRAGAVVVGPWWSYACRRRVKRVFVRVLRWSAWAPCYELVYNSTSLLVGVGCDSCLIFDSVVLTMLGRMAT